MTLPTPAFPLWHPIEASPEIKVWTADLPATPSEEAYELLSPSEQDRARRFQQVELRGRYVHAHAGLRRLLGRAIGQAAYPHEFQTSALGKPRLATHPSLHFNLSHSDQRALVAISGRFSVGVDIEQVRPVPEIPDLVQSHFTQAEQLQWESLTESERLPAFYQVWTRKEACVKALGWGLSVPLDRLETGVTSPPTTLSLALPSSGRVQLRLKSLSVAPGWAAALAWLESSASFSTPSDGA